MSIATEIARLQQAKADLKASINAKGGSLTNETLDQYASAVDNISVAKPTLNAPTISITDNALTITPNTNNGNFVTGYKVYSDGSLIATIQTTTLDLSTYLTTPATYSITAKAYGTNFNDSVASSSVSYTISSGYTLTLDAAVYGMGPEPSSIIRIKINTPPSNDSDYDAFTNAGQSNWWNKSGNPISNLSSVAKIYLWGTAKSQYWLNSESRIDVSTDINWTTPIEIVLSENSTLHVRTWWYD